MKQSGIHHRGTASWNGLYYIIHYDDGDMEEMDEHEVAPLIYHKPKYNGYIDYGPISEPIPSRITEPFNKKQTINKRKGRICIQLRRAPKRRATQKLLLPDDSGLRMFSETKLFEYKSFEGIVTYDPETKYFKLTSCSIKTPLLLTHEGFTYFLQIGLRILPMTEDYLNDSGSDDQDDSDLYNAESEFKLKMEIESASMGSSRSKQKTRYRSIKKANTNYIAEVQSLDPPPESLEELIKIALTVFMPRTIRDTQRYPPTFSLADERETQHAISTIYSIYRAMTQMYGGPMFNIANHCTLGMNGRKEVIDTHPRLRHVELTNDRDWPFDKNDCNQPIVINTRQWQLNGVPILDMVDSHIEKLKPMLPEVMNLMERCKERKMWLLNLGATNLTWNAWQRKPLGVDPGVTPLTTKASQHLKLWLGEAMILVSYHFQQVMLQMDSSVMMYEVSPARRRLLNIIAKELGLPESKWPLVLVEAVSLTLNTIVGWHADVQSDNRPSFQYTTTATTVIETHTLPTDSQTALESKGLLSPFHLVGIIGYNKIFIGDMADAEERREVIQTPGYHKLVEVINNAENGYGYQDFLEDQIRFLRFWKKNKKIHHKSTYDGVFAKRLECKDLMAYNSSFLDRNYNYVLFLHSFNETITYYEWTQLWVASFSETNGQHFHYKILSKWMRGFALDGEPFRSFRSRCQRCILYMFDCELYYDSQDKSYFKGACTDSRFTCFGHPICTPVDNNDQLKEQITIADEYVDKLIGSIMDPLCNAVGNTDTIHFSLHEDIKKKDIPRVSQGGVVFHRCIQMAATMGLIPTKYITCGRVYGYGPLTFCEEILGPGISLDEANQYFDQVHTDIQSSDSNFFKSNLEQVMCSEGRLRRKFDILYEDPTNGLPQNFFLAKRKTKSNVQMRILHRGRWEQLSHVFNPFYNVMTKTKSTAMELFPVSKSWITSYVDDKGKLSRLPQDMWE